MGSSGVVKNRLTVSADHLRCESMSEASASLQRAALLRSNKLRGIANELAATKQGSEGKLAWASLLEKQPFRKRHCKCRLGNGLKGGSHLLLPIQVERWWRRTQGKRRKPRLMLYLDMSQNLVNHRD